MELGMEYRALSVLGKCSIAELHPSFSDLCFVKLPGTLLNRVYLKRVCEDSETN